MPDNPLTVTPVVTPLTGANILAVDQTNAYWSDDLNIFDGTISSAPLAGGPVTTLVSEEKSPQGVEVDGGYLHWADEIEGTVKRVPVVGGSVTTLLAGQSGPIGVAVDGGNLYWTTLTGSRTGGAIRTAPLTTDGVGAQRVVIDGLNSPTGLAVDNGQVFWTDDLDGTANAVSSAGRSVTVVASGQSAPDGVAATAGQVYWANGDTTINTAPTSGTGPVTNLCSSLFDAPNGVAIGP